MPRTLRRINTTRTNASHNPRYEPIEREPVTDSVRDRIAELNRVDIALYSDAQARLREEREQMRAAIADGTARAGTRRPLLRHRLRRTAAVLLGRR
jgi:hypothetical protein